jgi:hypothetical protein
VSAVAAVREYLAGVAGINALVGDRVYQRVPRGAAYPHVRIIRTDIDYHPTLDGTANRLVNEMIEVDSLGVTAATAVAVDVAVRTALADWSGTAAGVVVEAVIIEGGAEDVIPPDHGDDIVTTMITQSYLVQWRT